MLWPPPQTANGYRPRVPQTLAYFSEADCLLYGGEPGGGKSQLILGLAFNCHERSLLMRRQYGDLERLIEDALKIHGSREGFNGSPPPRLRISDKQDDQLPRRAKDRRRTRHDGAGPRSARHRRGDALREAQIRFLMGWVRSETPASAAERFWRPIRRSPPKGSG
jgi:hypothetical protein